MKIIVVGAGLAGLTFALACQKAFLDVTVYDQTKTLSHIGGGIILWPQGLRYLEWLNLSHLLNPYKIFLRSCHILGNKGDQIFCEDYANFFSMINGGILPIERGHFQRVLLTELLPGTIKLNKKCIKISSDEHAAYVYFADGTKDCADLIVGADGIHSAVRKSFNKHLTPYYTNYCWWGGIIEQKNLKHLSNNQVYIALGQNKMCVIWPSYQKHFIWYLPVKMPYQDLKNKKTAKNKLQELFTTWQPSLQPLLTHTLTNKHFHLPILALPHNDQWTQQRIALIGDAAHAIGPILGQGVSEAIEDVFILMNCLQNKPHDIRAALNLYGAIRRPRHRKIWDLENKASDMLIHENLEELTLFEKQIKYESLASMYQELIPLVNEVSSLEIATMFAPTSLN